MKKIVLAGASTFTVKNMGDEAMLLNLIQAIKRFDKKIKIILLSRHPNKHFDKMYGIKTIKNLEFDKRDDSVGKFFYGFNSPNYERHLDQIRNHLIEADMFILAGNLFMELSPNTFLRGIASYSTTLALLSKFCNTDVYIASLNMIDEYRSPVVGEYLKFLSKITKKVLVREKSAKNLLLENSFDPKKVLVEGESAFGIEIPKRNKIVDNLIKKKKISKRQKLISVCLRAEYWRNDISENFFKKHAGILEKVALLTGSTLLFVPNVFGDGRKWMDDRNVHNQIIKRLDKRVKYINIDQELSLFDSVNLHQISNFHITNRRHSIVFAALNNITSAIINTNLKGHLEPLSKEIGLNKNLINFNSNENEIIKKIYFLWKSKKKIEKKMRPKVNVLKIKAKNQFKILIKNTKPNN